jgi:hypothetical protein
VVIGFIYSSNKQLFHAEVIIKKVAGCIDRGLEAADHWNFGIEGDTAFLMILFVDTVYLALYLLALFLDHFNF